MTDLYQSTKVVEAAKDWRVADRENIAAAPAAKQRTLGKKRHREQKLRDAVDELAKKAGQP